MNEDDFETLVREGFESLPQWVREKIKNVALLVEAFPSIEERRAQGLRRNETLLGLYKGVPLSRRGDYYGVGAVLPDTITIYREPILETAYEDGDDEQSGVYRERVRKIVADTVWHEYAHHFGMNEHEVRTREKQKGIEY